uniref:Zinc finger AN1-type containing 3 n=1 Tax=Amazona collaria TaxID=241587 RepID=A0A8B9FX92_9PSIT
MKSTESLYLRLTPTDFQKKQPDDDSAPSTSSSQSDLFSGEMNSDNSNTSLTTQAANSNQQLLTELNVTSPSKEECGPCTSTAHASLTTPTKRSCNSDSQSESEASPEKRPRLLDDSNDRPEETSRSKQKSRRRCFQCQTKLELVQQELGSCRCETNGFAMDKEEKMKAPTTAQSLYKVVQHVLTLMFLSNLGEILNCGSISMEPFPLEKNL